MKQIIKLLIISVFAFQIPLSYSNPSNTNLQSGINIQLICTALLVGGGLLNGHLNRRHEEKAEKKREKNRERRHKDNLDNNNTPEQNIFFNDMDLNEKQQVCRGVLGQASNTPMGSGRGGSELYIPLMGAGGLFSFLGPIGWAITGTTMFLVGMNQLSKYMEDKYIKSFSGDNIFSKAMCADRSTMPPLDKAIPVDWSVLEQSNLKIYKDGTATFWYSRVNDLGVYKSKEVSGRFALDVDYGTFIVGVDNQIFSVHTRGDDLVAIGVEPSKSGIHCPDPNYQLVYPLINQVALAKREAKTEAQVIGGGGSDRELTTKELNRIQGGFYCERIVHEMECGYHLPL